jgi:DNA-binding beta-propeller fold protein YncE
MCPAICHQRRRMVLGTSFGSALALAACAVPPPKVEDKIDRQPFWPRPPDRPRFIYEHTLRTPADIMMDVKELRLLRTLTGDQSANAPAFEKPLAVAARLGRIYVTDSVRRRVAVFDVPRRRVFAFGLRDPALRRPVGLAIDASFSVYVADSGRQRIMVYDSLGLLVRQIGTDKLLERPVGVAVNAQGTRVYAIDRASNDSDRHRVVMFDGAGNFLRHIGQRGSGKSEFNVPVAGACAPDGSLYLLDAGNFRVQVLTPDGDFKHSFGGVGIGFGDFARPRGIAVDAQGNVYVSDASFNNVQIFDAPGQLLLAVGATGRSDVPGRYRLLSGVAVDETGRIYLADQVFNKVEVLRPLRNAEAEALLKGEKLPGMP